MSLETPPSVFDGQSQSLKPLHSALPRFVRLVLLKVKMEVPAWDGGDDVQEYPAAADRYKPKGKKSKRRHELKRTKEMQQRMAKTVQVPLVELPGAVCSSRWPTCWLLSLRHQTLEQIHVTQIW